MNRQLMLGCLLLWRCAAQVPGYDGVGRDPVGFVGSLLQSGPAFYPLANIPAGVVTCQVSGETRTVRAEGLAELLGDVLIDCNGSLLFNPLNSVFVDYSGYTTVAPEVSQMNIAVTLSVPFTSKLVDGQLSEALLLIDDPVDPQPGRTPRNQNPCAQRDGVCPNLFAHSGSGSFLQPTGTAPFQTFIPGSVADGLAGGAAVTATGAPLNVFQGRRQNSQTVVFVGVPMADYDTRANPRILAAYNAIKAANNGAYNGQPVIVPWTKRFRIKNLRGLIAGNASTNGSVFANIGVQNPPANLQLNSATAVLANVQSGLTFQSTPLVTAPFIACLPANGDLLAGRPGDFETTLLARYREGYATAFRERGYSPGQDASLDQASPSGSYPTESGFYNSRFPTANGLNRAGWADSATRLRLALSNIPAGVSVFGSLSGTVGTTDTVGAYAMTESLVTPGFLLTARSFAVPANVLAAGVSPLGRVPGIKDRQGVFWLPSSGGRATGYWDVYAASPQVQEELVFALGVAYSLTGPVAFGAATLQGSFAPVTNGVPAFAPAAAGLPAFTVNPCSLNITTCPSILPDLNAAFYITLFGDRIFDSQSVVRWNPTGPLGSAPNSAAPRRAAVDTFVRVVSPNELRVLVPAGFNQNGGWFEILDGQRPLQVIPMIARPNPPTRVCSMDSAPTTEGVDTSVTVYGFFPGASVVGAVGVGTTPIDVRGPGTLGLAVLPGTLVRAPSVTLVESASQAPIGRVEVNPRPALNRLDPVLMTAGTTHSSRLRATGGTPPLQWSLRGGTSGARLQDVPGQPGQQDLVLAISPGISDPQQHTIAVDLQDSLGVSDQVTLVADVQPLPVLSITGQPDAKTKEMTITVTPRNAFSRAFKGRLFLEDVPSGSEAALVVKDTGQRTMDLDVQPCSPTLCDQPKVILRLGTVAGTFSLRAQTIEVPGVPLAAPLPGASLALEIRDAPPELHRDRITLVAEPGGLKVCAQGVTNTRELTEAQFRFIGTPGSGAGAAFAAPNVGDLFKSYFQPSQLGGGFQLEQNFTVNGNVKDVASVYVQLRNRAGATGEIGPIELATVTRCP